MTARRLAWVWLVLVAVTLVSWATASKDSVSEGAAAVAVALAFLKAGLVGWEFMDLRRAPAWLAGVFGAWVVVVGAVLVVLSLS
ncbi:cytochrome C oxidase subunit IV family protein [Nocardioides daeguensis]|uniref:Prokaryotic cytochrome C oxidase subunit IV family protein n=1 Tax=Nocardioides daeguensis TaxID=908359 RepID=A0ABP6UVA2_9ACTN|nr:cytochrome C oxidase subunit IV family protein [Nocardioides daeguensis]MBV6725557.1 cytochrome C oxidase subunit IV family protein [Nocardioides daeguensis]MCR1771417.1 cytochrome C oxidase subunit IV family protein [Nocardioides daeguensis]